MTETTLRPLPDGIQTQVAELSDSGNELAEQGQLAEAQARFEQALELFPEPGSQWQGWTELLAAVADMLFSSGNFKDALLWLERAAGAPDSSDNAWLELRLGQVFCELEDPRAAGHLGTALSLGGPELFDDEDPKYFGLAADQVPPPDGLASWEDARLP